MRPTVPRHLFAACAFALLACGGESTDSTEPALSGRSRILITDAPFPFHRVARVDLHVVSVSASLSTDTSAAGGGTFTTIAAPNRKINVLALQNGLTEELGTASLPAGAVTALRMVIDTDLSSITLKNGTVLTGSSNPRIQWQSSAGRPVLNALLHENIIVPDSGAVIVIDVDVGKTFLPPQEIDPASTDSGFIFSPILHAADGARTGSIAGTVRAVSASGAPVTDASLRLYLGSPSTPENTWIWLATAKTDANGAFKFSYVTQSARWAANAAHAGKSYIVSVDPPPGSGRARAVVPNLTVTARNETSAGTIVLP